MGGRRTGEGREHGYKDHGRDSQLTIRARGVVSTTNEGEDTVMLLTIVGVISTGFHGS